MPGKKFKKGWAVSQKSWQSPALRQMAAASLRSRGVHRVKGAIRKHKGGELKFVDIASANYAPVAASGTVTLLNGIAETDDYTGRDGRQARMKSVHIRGYSRRADATTDDNLCRVLLVWDNAPNGTIATVAQIMTADSAVSFPLVDNQNRFTILRDWQKAFAAVFTDLVGSPTVGEIDEYVKLDSITQFNGTGATIASIQNGALYMVILGTAAADAQNMLTLATRVRFEDV